MLVDTRINQLREMKGKVAAMTLTILGLHSVGQPTSLALDFGAQFASVGGRSRVLPHEFPK